MLLRRVLLPHFSSQRLIQRQLPRWFAAVSFDTEVTRLYKTLSTGLRNVAESNPGFRVVEEADGKATIELPNDRGKYSFEKLSNEAQMFVISPKSGEHYYKFDEGSGFWRSEGDDHIMLELLTRELLDLRGCPQF